MKHFTDNIINQAGVPVSGATVTVFLTGTQTTAQIYSDDGVTLKGNPVTTDALGRYDFFVADGRYDLSVSGTTVVPVTVSNIEIADITQASPSDAEWQTQTIGFENQATNPVPPVGFVNLYAKAADKNLYFKDETGKETPVGGATGSNILPLNNNFTGINTFNNDLVLKGPNPYVDIRAFGARAVSPNITPAVPGITANCVATQATVNISNASTFVNGDGVVLYGCGNPHSMPTPAAPTVTPSLALAGTGTLVNTPGAAGTTTYNYQIIARDRNLGLTAASGSGSTSTGAAGLGIQIVNISSLARSGQTVTVTTATPHGFLVGCGATTCGEVVIGSSNGLTDPTFVGSFLVTSAVDSSHFTFIGPGSTALGATPSATGGTATFYNCNLVSWSAVAGAVDYAIYSDRNNPGTFALIGVSNPNSSTAQPDLVFEDYGSPMMDNQAFPPEFPVSYAAGSPPTATSDALSTTILLGAGTTTLTLANAAGTTVNNRVLLLDSCPAMQAAAASIVNGNGTLLIPATSSGQFVVNSWCQLNVSYGIAQNGPLYLNNTLEVIGGGNGGVQWQGQPTAQFGSGKQVSGWSSGPRINVNTAHPGIYFSGAQFGLHVSHISPNAVPANGSKMIFFDSAFNQTFEWIDCGTGGSGADYMSSCFEQRPNAPGNNFASNVNFDYVGLSPGNGASQTPALYLRGAAGVVIPHIYMVHRGIQVAPGGLSLGVNGMAYMNGGSTPLLTSGPPTSGASSNTGGLVTIGNHTLDTVAQPSVAALNPSVPINVQFLSGIASPSSGVLPISGFVGTVNTTYFNPLINSFPNATGLLGTNIGSNNIITQNFQNAWQVVNSNYASFINNVPMPAPTCSVSPGGSLVVGTNYTFFVVPVWQNGQEGQSSLQSGICTPTTGNQTITINWTTAPGNPKGYNVYYCIAPCGSLGVGGSAAANTFNNPQPAGATSLTFSSAAFNSAVASGISRGGPTIMMQGAQGIAAPVAIVPTVNASTLSSSSALLIDTVGGPSSAGNITLQAATPSSGTAAGGSIVLTPGTGAGGNANGSVSVSSGFYVFLPTFTFATLGTPSGGAVVYCSDCTVASPCAGSGTGALAKRLGSTWVCN